MSYGVLALFLVPIELSEHYASDLGYVVHPGDRIGNDFRPLICVVMKSDRETDATKVSE